MRPAAEILLAEAAVLPDILAAAPAESFDLPTVCTDWSVRDVLAHCSAALTRTALGNLHGFTPEDNQRDVDARRTWPLADVLAELFKGYEHAAAAIDAAGGSLDGVGLGEWMHGGDVREALGRNDAYISAGVELAVPLLLERSRATRYPSVSVTLEGTEARFGPDGVPVGDLTTDVETFVRLCGGRRPAAARYQLSGVEIDALVLFT